MRRTRRLYANREGVVDGARRWTYGEFFDRCDRWSSALQRLGVKQGDRVAYIAPNTHAQLESFYAVPQLGAVLVPLNFRLVADDFRYMIQHSGAKVVCVSDDYLAAVDSIRADLKTVTQFVALDPRQAPPPLKLRGQDEDGRAGLAGLRRLDRERVGRLHAARHRRERSAHHQLHERHDLAAEGRDDHAPQRVDELRRHAGAHADDPGRHLPVDAADVSRQRVDVHLDGDGGGRTARLPAQVRRPDGVSRGEGGAGHAAVRRADRADHAGQRAGGSESRALPAALA